MWYDNIYCMTIEKHLSFPIMLYHLYCCIARQTLMVILFSLGMAQTLSGCRQGVIPNKRSSPTSRDKMKSSLHKRGASFVKQTEKSEADQKVHVVFYRSVFHTCLMLNVVQFCVIKGLYISFYIICIYWFPCGNFTLTKTECLLMSSFPLNCLVLSNKFI